MNRVRFARAMRSGDGCQRGGSLIGPCGVYLVRTSDSMIVAGTGAALVVAARYASVDAAEMAPERRPRR
jgi:hypothetical protein